MTNEEKANEICKRHCFDSNLYDGCMEMAEWKEQQMIEKACKWLELYANEYAFADYTGDELNGEAYVSNKLIQDFKKAMEEQL